MSCVDSSIRCEIEPIKFFSTYIIPILEMSVDLKPKESVALVEAVSAGVRAVRIVDVSYCCTRGGILCL